MAGECNTADKGRYKNSQNFCEILKPLQELAQRIDNKLPRLEGKLLEGPPAVVNEHNFPYEGWNKLQRFKEETKQMTTNCERMLAIMDRNGAIMSDLSVCAGMSLKIAMDQFSSLESAFSAKGYVKPVKVKAETSDNSREDVSTMLTVQQQIEKENNPCNDGDDDMTYVIKGFPIKSNAMPTPKSVVVPLKETINFPDSPCSPQLPELNMPSYKRSAVYSPKEPTFIENDTAKICAVTQQCKEQYFATIASPVLEVPHKVKENAASVFFAQLNTPKTPVLTKVVKNHRVVEHVEKEMDSSNDSDDDNLVIHSRKSFMQQNHFNHSDGSPGTPEITVNLLKTKSKLATPDTPDFGKSGLMNVAHGNELKYFNKPLLTNQSLQSPDTPDIPFIESRPLPSIDEKAYNKLPTAVKRIISFEQATDALHSMQQQVQTSSRRTLSSSEIDDVIMLGLRSKSCIYVLACLNMIRKVPGTNEYEILG